jgi:hypothetical protein
MQPTRIFIPQLSKEAEAWYIWIWNTFSPFYEMYTLIGQSFGDTVEAKEARFIRLTYSLLPMFGCEEISFSRPLASARIFNCGDVYMVFYVHRYVEEPKGKPKIDFDVIKDRISNELLVIAPYPLPFEFALGSQPTLNIDIGRYRVKRLELFKSRPGLDIYLDWLQLRGGLPKVTRIPIDFSIPSYSTSPIGIVFSSSSIDRIRTKEQADVATKVLSAIYEHKRDEIAGYVEKVSEFLSKIFRGLTTYLLY